MRQSIDNILQTLRDSFPEFEGRVVACSGDVITKDILPRLPLIAVQLTGISADSVDYKRGVNNRLGLRDEYQIELWLEPRRIKQKSGLESPFWSYQDAFSPLMRVMTALYKLESGQFEFVETQILPAPYALIFSYKIRQHYLITPAECAEEPEGCAVITPEDTVSLTFTLSKGEMNG